MELDLLRGGTRLPMLDPWPSCPYTILIARQMTAPRCRVLKAHSLKPLPEIAVPLLYGEADVKVALQPLIDAMYERYRYHRNIDYTKPPPFPLAAKETAWLREHIKDQTAQDRK